MLTRQSNEYSPVLPVSMINCRENRNLQYVSVMTTVHLLNLTTGGTEQLFFPHPKLRSSLK